MYVYKNIRHFFNTSKHTGTFSYYETSENGKYTVRIYEILYPHEF